MEDTDLEYGSDDLFEYINPVFIWSDWRKQQNQSE
jgi:hypothetical protein